MKQRWRTEVYPSGDGFSFQGPASHPRWAAASTEQWGTGARLTFWPHQKALPALHRAAPCRSKGSGHARGAPALAESYKHRMVQQEAKLLKAAETPPTAGQSLVKGLSQLYSMPRSQSGWKGNFILIKLAVQRLTENQQLSGTLPCAALLPRYLPGPHLSGFLCHSMHPHCLSAPVTRATLPLQAGQHRLHI